MLDAFRDLPQHQLVLMGSGPAAPGIAAMAQRYPNIHWRPPVDMNDVLRYAAGCDVGIALIEDTCLSYRFCLPNKLHEYRAAGLPVIVSDLPEMAGYIDENKCGWKVEPTTEGLRALVSRLDWSSIHEKIAEARTPPVKWLDEKRRYISVLHDLLQSEFSQVSCASAGLKAESSHR
jgi:glycosyltransferase involved in cell wall biosynthesis